MCQGGVLGSTCGTLSGKFQESSINSTSVENVIRKFLPRLADCTIDVDVSVQEKAIALFLRLDRANFLEDFEDDALWAQINNRALMSDTSYAVRRDALQFVVDQLEAFDNDEDEAARSKTWAKKRSASIVQSSNKTAAKQLATLAGWYRTELGMEYKCCSLFVRSRNVTPDFVCYRVAHILTEGPIPMDEIRIQLTDYIVDSLRDIPELKSLATNWSAMMLVRAFHETRQSGRTN
jgi:cohesin complex subunit SA-1/2